MEMVIKQIRWKAIFQDTKKEKKSTSKGMDYAVLPRPVKEFSAVESEFIELVENIKLRKVKNSYRIN